MQILVDNNGNLIYECILCHKLKPIGLVKAIDGYYFCRECKNEYIQSEKIQEPIITMVVPNFLMPTPTDIELFFTDIKLFNYNVSSSLVNDILILSSKVNKSIKISISAIIQLLADKYRNKSGVLYPEISLKYNQDFKEYMDNIYITTEEKLKDASLKFNRIMSLDDARIRNLCNAYHDFESILLRFKVEYMLWEKGLISSMIQSKVASELHEKDKQVSQIQQEYAESLTNEKVANNTKLENYSREILRLQGMVDSLNSITSSKKEELNTLKLEKDEMYGKYKSLELQLQEKGVEISKLNFDNGKLKRELEKHKIVEQWMLDPTSVEEEPTYFNQVTGEHITYPKNFKENYKPDSVDMDKDILIYKERSGDKEFKLPKSLLQFVKSQNIPENGTIINKSGKKLKENHIKILNVLSREKKDGLTRKEICDMTEKIGEKSGEKGIKQSHVGDYLKELMEINLIIMFEDENKDERFYRI